MRRFFLRLGNLLHAGRAEAEMSREIASHLLLLEEDFERRGMPPAAARRAARLAYGGVDQAKELHRDSRTFAELQALMKDVRHATRALLRAPAFAVVAVLTLALGIGANTAIFSVVDGVLLKPLSYPHSDRLVALRQMAPGAGGLANMTDGLSLSASMYFTYAEQNRSFSSVGAWISDSAAVTGAVAGHPASAPEQVRVTSVTDGVLQTLAVPPAIGRWLLASDQRPNGAETVMLGYGYWQRRFGRDPGVVGQMLTVDGRPREIVGVMPRGFRIVDSAPDLIVPLAFDRGKLTLAGFAYNGIARLRDGATIAQANADMARMLPIWMDTFSNGPGTNSHFYERWRITPSVRPLQADVVGDTSGALWAVMAMIGLVMLIAFANVTNLFFVRAESRQQELAVRAALGAGTGRIIRGLLIESVLAALAGGAVGIGIAQLGLHFLRTLDPANLPRLQDIALDGRSLTFALALALLCGLFSGLIPALKYAGSDLAAVLRSGGRAPSPSRNRQRTRNLLVVAQVAMAFVLLVSAGLLIRTFAALRSVNPGFTDAAHLQTFRLTIPRSLAPDGVEVTQLRNQIADRLAAVPGVESAAFISEMPMEELGYAWDNIETRDRPLAAGDNSPMRIFKFPSPGYFHTAGTRMIAGRELSWDDVYNRHAVVLVSDDLARELWGKPSAALGQRVRETSRQPWSEVIGVVQDVREDGVQRPAPAVVYWPPLSGALVAIDRTATFVLRSDRAGTQSLLVQVRQAVESVNAELPVANPRTMASIYSKSLALTSFTMVMLAIAAAMALALGVIGIYGVIAYAVSQRRREIGIRMALGARASEVRAMFVRHGVRLAAAGVGLGLVAATGITRLLKSLLYGMSPVDPLTYAAVPLVLLAAVALASYLPARRASAVDPVEVMKAE